MKRTQAKLPVLIGLFLLSTLIGCYIRDGYTSIRAAKQAAASADQALVLAQGDVAFRDMPKAQAMAAGNWYDDPAYVNEVHWYPFMQPMTAVWYSNLAHEPLETAYMFASMVISAAALPALAVLCTTYAGPVGLLCVPFAIITGVYWPNNTTFPGGVGELFFLLYLAVAAWAFKQVVNRGGDVTPSLGALGAATGVLALCHGASFVTACWISAALLLVVVIRGRMQLQHTLPAIGWFLFAGFVASSPLIVPQLLHYGALRQADDARLFLQPDVYGTGDALARLITLALLPRDFHSLAAGAFVILSVCRLLPFQRAMTAPLWIGYLVALLCSHLGFVLHANDQPQLARIAAALLLAPPHTFIAIWTLLANCMLLLLCAALVHVLIVRVAAQATRVLNHSSEQIAAVLLTVLVLSCYGLLTQRWPAQVLAETETIPRQQAAFFSQVATLAGPNQTVYVAAWAEQREFLRAAPFKVLFLHTPYHRNPYVNAERAQAEAALNLPLEHQAELDAVLTNYRVRYMLTVPGHASALVRICRGQRVLTSETGVVLWQLAPPCRV